MTAFLKSDHPHLNSTAPEDAERRSAVAYRSPLGLAETRERASRCDREGVRDPSSQICTTKTDLARRAAGMPAGTSPSAVQLQVPSAPGPFTEELSRSGLVVTRRGVRTLSNISQDSLSGW